MDLYDVNIYANSWEKKSYVCNMYVNEDLKVALWSSASARTSPAASTINFTGFFSWTFCRSCSKSCDSAVQAKTTPSCRARRAKCDSTGKSRDTTTPRTSCGTSSSPLASLQKSTAPSGGKVLVIIKRIMTRRHVEFNQPRFRFHGFTNLMK